MKFNYHGTKYDVVEIILFGEADGHGDRRPNDDDIMKCTDESTGKRKMFRRAELGMFDGIMNVFNREIVRRKMERRMSHVR